jgi:hypothetical protein
MLKVNALDRFLSLPGLQQLFLAVLFLTLFGVGLFLLIMAIRALKIKSIPTSGGPIILGDDREQNREKRKAYCGVPVKDVVVHFSKMQECRDLIDRIKLEEKDTVNELKQVKLPREIMQDAVDFTEKLSGMLESVYLFLLKSTGMDKVSLTSAEQFKFFRLVVKAMQPQIITEFRRMMRENGWEEKEANGTFHAYLDKKSEDFVCLIIALLNDYYIIKTPSMTELYDVLMLKIREPHGVIDSLKCLINGFLISSKNTTKKIKDIKEDNVAKIEAIQKELNCLFVQLLGD